MLVVDFVEAIRSSAAPRRAVGLGKRTVVSAVFETRREDDQVEGRRLTGIVSFRLEPSLARCRELSATSRWLSGGYAEDKGSLLATPLRCVVMPPPPLLWSPARPCLWETQNQLPKRESVISLSHGVIGTLGGAIVTPETWLNWSEANGSKAG